MKTTELNGSAFKEWMGEVTGDILGFWKLCKIPSEGVFGDVSYVGDVSELPKSLADLQFLQLP